MLWTQYLLGMLCQCFRHLNSIQSRTSLFTLETQILTKQDFCFTCQYDVSSKYLLIRRLCFAALERTFGLDLPLFFKRHCRSWSPQVLKDSERESCDNLILRILKGFEMKSIEGITYNIKSMCKMQDGLALQAVSSYNLYKCI